MTDPGTGLWRYCTWRCAIDKLQTVHDSTWAARKKDARLPIISYLSFFFKKDLWSSTDLNVDSWFHGWGATSTEFYHHEIRGLRSCSGRCLWPVMWWQSPSINLRRTSDSTPANSLAAQLEVCAVLFLSLRRVGVGLVPALNIYPIASFELLANPELWGGIAAFKL